MNNDNDKKSGKADPSDTKRNESAPKENAIELMLVAYLDGELGEDEREEMEARLTAQPELRRRLDQLRQAWDLLDELEASSPSKRFVETTLEMVAIDAEKHLRADAMRKRRAMRRRRNGIGLGMLAALGAGFALIWFFHPSPDAVLIHNLSVIQKLDQYESAESVAFLEALVEAKLFPVQPAEKSGRPSLKAETEATGSEDTVQKEPMLDQAPPIPMPDRLRREWVEDLPSVQRAQLVQNWERFEQLAPEQREKLIRLHHQLAEAERSELLTKVMSEYNEWLRRRPSFERNDLLGLSAEDRINELRKLRQHALDRKGFQEWLTAKREIREDRLAREPPLPDEKPKLPRNPFANSKARPWLPSPHRPWLSRLDDEDFADLENYLSEETAKQWRKKSIREQRRWAYWVDFLTHMEKTMDRRGFRRSGSVSDEDLAQFFERLPPEKQSELLTKRGDMLRQELIELYKQSVGQRPLHNGPPDHRGGRGREHRQPRPHRNTSVTEH